MHIGELLCLLVLGHYTVLTGVKAALAYKPHPDFEQKNKTKIKKKKKN